MKSTNWHNSKKIIKLHIVIVLIGIIYIIWYRLTHIGIPCVFHTVTGLYCPGCGISRMFFELSQFDFLKAFHNNVLAFILLPYGVFVYIRHMIYIMKGKGYKYKKRHQYISYAILALVIAFGILRNIPCFYYFRP